MVNLSVNINKIALLRNARGSDRPNVLRFARLALDAGAAGITVHPRPDQRHITAVDALELAQFMSDQTQEYNIEGNPFEGAMGSFQGLWIWLCKQSLTNVRWYQIVLIKKHRIMDGTLIKMVID